MSNDTNYTIKVTGETETVKNLIQYLEKRVKINQSWREYYQNYKGKITEEVAKKYAASIGLADHQHLKWWDMGIEKITHNGNSSVAELWSWANENGRNSDISGEGGQLAQIYGEFPRLNYEVKYNDEYSWGICSPPFFDKEPSQESEETLGYDDLEFMKELEIDTSSYRYLGEDGAEFFSSEHSNAEGDYDLSGIEKLTENDAKQLAKYKKGKIKLRPELEAQVESHRGKQEKLGRARPSNLVKNESKLRNSKARKKPAKKKTRK